MKLLGSTGKDPALLFLLIEEELDPSPCFEENYGMITMPEIVRPSLLREAFIMKNTTALNKVTHKGSTPH
jgi:hypothetical protein